MKRTLLKNVEFATLTGKQVEEAAIIVMTVPSNPPMTQEMHEMIQHTVRSAVVKHGSGAIVLVLQSGLALQTLSDADLASIGLMRKPK